MDLSRRSVPGRRNSQSKASAVGRYPVRSIAGRPVWLEGRGRGGEWEEPEQQSLMGCSEAVAFHEEIEVLKRLIEETL